MKKTATFEVKYITKISNNVFTNIKILEIKRDVLKVYKPMNWSGDVHNYNPT